MVNKPAYSDVAAAAAAEFNKAVDAGIIAKIGNVPGLSSSIVSSDQAFSGAPQPGGKAPPKTREIDF